MPIKTRVAGIWKAIKPSAKVGTTIHEIQKVFANVAGTWHLVFENQLVFTISSDQTNYKLKDHLPRSAPTDIIVNIEAGVTIKSTSKSYSAFYVTGITGKNITINNHGSIEGYFGAGGITSSGSRGGTAMYITVDCVVNNFGNIYGGGGGGGSGGKGANGSYTTSATVDVREPTTGDLHTDVHASASTRSGIFVNPGHRGHWTVQIYFNGTELIDHEVMGSDNPFAGSKTTWSTGGWTYHKGTDHRTASDIAHPGILDSGIYRTKSTTSSTSHATVGSIGGRGGNGQYTDHAAADGVVGSVPPQGAGRGGKGGIGGTWGQNGGRGTIGDPNSDGNHGSDGSAGGLGGHAIDGIRHVTLTNTGNILGGKVH